MKYRIYFNFAPLRLSAEALAQAGLSADKAGSIRRPFERPENFREGGAIPTAREKQM